MARQRPAQELSVEELRRLLIEKKRAERMARLDHFRKTGRVILVEPDAAPPRLDSLRSEALIDEDGQDQVESIRSADPGGDGPEPDQDRPESDGASRPARKTRRGGRERKPWVDRLLLFVEVGAVIGLLLILLSGMNLLRNLNTEVASVLAQPTLTPTPVIMAVVLPSGHTPPDSPGGVQFNEAEIPEHLKPLVQNLANLPVPAPSQQQAIRIQIPAINVDAPVVQGDGWEQLKKGVGQHLGTPNPGETGNIVLSAHNDVFGEIFRHLDQLKEGDEVIVFTSQRTFTYIVRQTQIVEPTQVEVMAPTQEPVVTLISCFPYLKDTQRIVVSAYLLEE